MKLAIVYHSATGNTARAAEIIKEGMMQVPGIEVVLYNVKDEVPADALDDVKGVILGAPSYYAEVSWQMMQFLETSPVKFSDKLGAAFCTANFEHGGSEVVITTLNTMMLAKGMLVYSGGTSHGMPMTHIGANAFVHRGTTKVDERAELLTAFGKRFAEKAAELFK